MEIIPEAKNETLKPQLNCICLDNTITSEING